MEENTLARRKKILINENVSIMLEKEKDDKP